jgi:hypothetical protein
MIWRIHRHVMRMLGEQMRDSPASHTLGIGSESVWMVARLKDGHIGVGSFGGNLMTVDEVAAAINEHQVTPADGGGRDTVGM